MTRIRGGGARVRRLLCWLSLLSGVTTAWTTTPTPFLVRRQAPCVARHGSRLRASLDGDESSRSSSSSSSSALSETVDDDNRSSRAQQQFETRPDSVQPFSNVTTTTTTITPSATRFLATAVAGPTLESKPDYENMVGPLGRRMDRLFCTLFRRELAAQVGGADSTLEADDYQGIIELAARMNREIPHREEIQQRAQTVLRNLFPSWMPGSYAVLFSKPFPAFSSRMNAWATWVAGTWLMGDCEINTVPVDGDQLGIDQGLLVKRCRFLEESGCASVCVNSCKIPTQRFFAEEMGLPLLMEPDYETYECQFSFGRTPTLETEGLAQATPCLQRCPTAGSLRSFHQDSANAESSVCPFMDEAV